MKDEEQFFEEQPDGTITPIEPTGNKSASEIGSDAHFKPASDYTDEGLVQLALEVYARAATYMNKELHDRAMEAKQELLKRLKERH
jgi:hypothetical protein